MHSCKGRYMCTKDQLELVPISAPSNPFGIGSSVDMLFLYLLYDETHVATLTVRMLGYLRVITPCELTRSMDGSSDAQSLGYISRIVPVESHGEN